MDFEIKNGSLIKYHGSGPDIVIPEGVTKIKSNAFPYFSDFISVTLPTTLKCIEHYGLGKSYKTVRVPSLEAWMGIQFNDDHSSPVGYESDLIINGALIENLVIPKDTVKINDYCFIRCRSLKRVEIPGATAIGDKAFFGCKDLKEVILSDSVKKIGQEAFYECTSLEKIQLPSGLKEIEEYTFRLCKLEEITIPESVTRIGRGAFEYCDSLKRITLPKNVTTIEADAFIGCEGLESIVIPDKVKMIGAGAFDKCTNLKEITIPSSVKKITTSMLPPNLEKIVIKGSISVFDDKTFKSKKNLTSVYISEDQYVAAKKLIKNAKFYNLDGEEITGAKKKAMVAAAAAATPANSVNFNGKTIAYPADAQIPAAIEPYVMSKGTPKSFAKPAVSELYYQADGKTFTVTLKIASKLPAMWKRYYVSKEDGVAYDPETVLWKAFNRRPYVDDGSGEMIYNPLYEDFPNSVSPLSADEVEKRLAAFVTLLNRCVLEETVKTIMNKAERKKNGMLYKGRVLHLAYLDLVDKAGDTYELVAKNEDDTNMTLELRSKVPVTDDLLEQTFLFQ